MTARMPPGWRSAAAAISAARSHTSSKPARVSNAPAKVSAATSPSEKPAQAAGATPRSRRAAAAARSCTNTQGCVFSVCESSSLEALRHCSLVPGRTSSAMANTSAAAGDVSIKSTPIAGCWAPWPANKNATPPMRTHPSGRARRHRPGRQRFRVRSGAR